MKNIFLILLLVNGFFENIFAQELYNYETKGDRYYFSYSYDRAIVNYNLARNLSLIAQRKLADSYQQTYQSVEAEKVYQRILKAKEGVLPEDYYNYAMACRINRKYNEADKWMQVFVLEKPLDLRAIDYKLNSDKLRGLINDSTEFSIQNLAMNTDALDFGTSYFNNQIVFSSSRANGIANKKKYNWTGKPFWEMYVSEIKEGNLIKSIPFDESLRSKLNDGPASFSNDGTFMAFTRNQIDNKRKDRTIELEIYFSSFQNGAWTEPIPFYLNNINYSVGHPCLTKDGNTMFFASDIPGGYGKADIYSINKNEKGDWENPRNLGNSINTEGDDMFPFISENQQKLYFSSEGHFGLGGLDIFSSSKDSFSYNNITNLGSPVNSSSNDYGFILNSKTGTGFFSSDRIGGKGGDDIYSYSISDDIKFTIIAPINNPIQQKIREFFPIRNYVFFNPYQTGIANRYALLRKDQVAQFMQQQLSENTDKDLATRAKRQMLVYYNLLNIIGARMKDNPSATITLVGSSEKGPSESLIMANSIKLYLTEVFEINPNNIFVEGRFKPEVPSEQPGGKIDLNLLREGDRRVTIESTYPAILKEFEIESSRINKSTNAYKTTQDKKDGFLFSVSTEKNSIESWSLQIKDQTNNVMYYGPYKPYQIFLPKDSIIGANSNSGNYTAQMIALTNNGIEITRNAEFSIAKMPIKSISDILRFSIIFEFDDAKSVEIYKQFLTETVTPKIPYGATVILNGYTDIIGLDEHNNDLSLRRMKSVKMVIEDIMSRAGRSDVIFEEYWHGGNTVTFPFANKLPEERFYNRTVFIDVIPKQ